VILLSLGRYVLFGMVAALALGAGGALAPPGRAAGQPQPTLVLSPSSGPCDATVDVVGTGFQPGAYIPIDLGAPHSNVTMARLALATPGPDGEFNVQVAFGSLGCEAAARDAELDYPGEPADLVIFAGYDPTRLFVMAQAAYHYTTTTPSVARVLPPAGDGSGVQRGSGVGAVIAGLAGVGAVLLAAGLSAAALAARMRRQRC